MKKAVKISTIAIIVLFVCYTESASDTVFKLDMAPDSADDQFIGCEDQMYDLITQKILPNELNSDENFKYLWDHYKDVNDYFKRVIKVYTTEAIHSQFNNAVSSGRKNYNSNFNYKALHFLLTRAIQIYQVKTCTNVFRRTEVSFDKNVLGHEMRFGRFASTSLKKDMTDFGSTSCFKIKTCFGAKIAHISVTPEEKEVLIPPFEKFKIAKIEKNRSNCDVVYTLQSTGKVSNMNCELTKNLQKVEVK
ncbi:T-cell ecto-ADP-ribosyltransferase 1-like [Clarias gariepinus]|uniref:T-cell ecto-ADP-ribosyltransferase 1-like n=1 Tax=Clarias gariepinus TaxID=13013 RepID=UPI00234C2BA2|nr:T-cell ecto-ADP-ribosyltransferase 1-like [Clarias gariepinus]